MLAEDLVSTSNSSFDMPVHGDVLSFDNTGPEEATW